MRINDDFWKSSLYSQIASQSTTQTDSREKDHHNWGPMRYLQNDEEKGESVKEAEHTVPTCVLGHITGYWMGQGEVITVSHHEVWRTFQGIMTKTSSTGWRFSSLKKEFSTVDLSVNHKMDHICKVEQLWQETENTPHLTDSVSIDNRTSTSQPVSSFVVYVLICIWTGKLNLPVTRRRVIPVPYPCIWEHF